MLDAAAIDQPPEQVVQLWLLSAFVVGVVGSRAGCADRLRRGRDGRRRRSDRAAHDATPAHPRGDGRGPRHARARRRGAARRRHGRERDRVARGRRRHPHGRLRPRADRASSSARRFPVALASWAEERAAAGTSSAAGRARGGARRRRSGGRRARQLGRVVARPPRGRRGDARALGPGAVFGARRRARAARVPRLLDRHGPAGRRRAVRHRRRPRSARWRASRSN